jgi:hypothetical protein
VASVVDARTVVVVGETPSLGRAIGDLLLTEGIPCRLVSDLSARELDPRVDAGATVVLVACNEAYCRTARRWVRGELPGTTLVVVGARDPALRGLPGVRVVPLPFQREPLVALLRDLLSVVPSSPR